MDLTPHSSDTLVLGEREVIASVQDLSRSNPLDVWQSLSLLLFLVYNKCNQIDLVSCFALVSLLSVVAVLFLYLALVEAF